MHIFPSLYSEDREQTVSSLGFVISSQTGACRKAHFRSRNFNTGISTFSGFGLEFLILCLGPEKIHLSRLTYCAK